MIKSILITALLLINPVLSVSVFSQEDNTSSRLTIIFGAENNFPPYEFLDDRGQLTGINIDLIRAIGEMMDFDISFQYGPPDIMFESLKKGRVQALLVNPTEERAQYANFTEPLITEEFYIFVRFGGPQYNQLEDIRNQEVIVKENSPAHELLLTNEIPATIIPVLSEIEAMEVLSSSMHDCAFISRLGNRYIRAKYQQITINRASGPLLISESCFAVAKGDSILIDILNEGIKKLKMSSQYNDIVNTWNVQIREVEFSFWDVVLRTMWYLLPLIFLLILAVSWNWILRRKVNIKTYESQRANRFLKTLTECDQTIVRAADEQTLLNGICKIMGKHRIAWIGMLNDEDQLEPVAFAGLDKSAFTSAMEVERECNPEERPAIQAIKTGKMVAIDNIQADPGMAPWRKIIITDKPIALVALPLKNGVINVGCLLIYTTESDAFNKEEMKLLHELSENINFGITSLRTRSELVRALQSLEDSERRLSTVIHSSPHGILISRLNDNTILDTNAAFLEIIGYTIDDVIGKTVDEFINPEISSKLKKLITNQISSIPDTEIEFTRKNGEVRNCILSAKTFYMAHETYYVIFLIDITLIKQAEMEIKSLARFPAEDPDPVMRLTNDGITIYANDPAAALLAKFDSYLGTEAPSFLLEKIKEITGGEIISNIDIKCDDQTYSLHVAPIVNEGYINLYGRNVTERLNLEEQLRQSQKMEAIGQLAGGIAHDFNNMLSVIIGYAETAMDIFPDNNELRPLLQEIENAGDRAAALTRQLLAFSRKQVMQPEVININRIISSIQDMLKRLIEENIEFETILADDIGNVKADPGQIQQVIMNLVVNAHDAMPHGGKLIIETNNVSLDEEYLQHRPMVKSGQYVLIAVSDTGIGMDVAIISRIFEPFFTTKQEHRGTGLGLATSYGIVKQSGGHIWVYSEIGKGSTFKVYLPRVDESEKQHREITSHKPVQGTETILVVEDEESVRKIVEHILTGYGFKVLSASNSDEVDTICSHSGNLIDLVLTDVVMPGMSGREIAENLKKAYPKIAIIYMSGYTDNAIVHHGILDQGTHFIGKPFSTIDLVRKVREVLDERET